MDERGRIVDVVVFCIAGFVIPAFCFLIFWGRIEDNTIYLRLQSFAENISTKGYVDYAMYESFIEELNRAGVLMIPEFYVEHELLAPEYKMRSIEDAEGYLDGLWTGGNGLHQGTVTVQRPTVTDQGIPPAGSLTENVNGANTSTTGPSASHIHTGACYTGTQHFHDESCPSRDIDCTAGCVKHTHTGSSSSGTGCYRGGKYYSGGRYYCGSFSVTGTGSSIEVTCGNCGGSYTITSLYMSCSGCGYPVSYSSGQCSCSRFDDSMAYSHYQTYPGYYGQNCGKNEGTYYDSTGLACTACGGDGKMTTSACTKTNGGYYNADGSACTSLCNQIVTSLAPMVKEQVVVAGTGVDARVKVVFADGHSEIVDATVTGFNSTAYNVVQTIKLSYGTYSGSLSNKTKTECTIKIMVRYPSKTCSNGHFYYLVTGNTTTCPYCKAYPKTLVVLGATEEPFHITKGTSLKQNGISIRVTYYDGRTEVITSGWQDNLDMNYVGGQTVTIAYLGALATLRVYSDRVKVLCQICGYEYALYPDNTDPGCPKCLAAIPVFTGNVLRYTESISYAEILGELYHGDGIYYFSRGDRLELQLWEISETPVDSVLGKFFGRGAGEELVCMYGVKIRDEKVRK